MDKSKVPQELEKKQKTLQNANFMSNLGSQARNTIKNREQVKEQLVMNTPLMNGRTTRIDDDSPINTPNIGSTLFQSRKNDLRTKAMFNNSNYLNKITKNGQPSEEQE